MLKVENVSYQYNDSTKVLDDILLTINEGEIICLLGESGSGKTTLLRAIAGLENDYDGLIRYQGQTLKNIPIHQRGFGLMFQDFALFPHMTVAQNIAFGLKMQGIESSEQSTIISNMLALVGLKGYEKRDIDALSGGQKQRVALARSLAPSPSLLMLDEPLGSLDAGLRERLVIELREIIKKIGLTAIYVTHDQQEAYAIADRIAVMNKGKIEQFDTAEALYHKPKTSFVAEFLGLNNIVSAGFLQQYTDIHLIVDQYLIHPDNIQLDERGILEATIIERVFQGDSYRLKVQIDSQEFTFKVPTSQLASNEKSTVRLTIDMEKVHPLVS